MADVSLIRLYLLRAMYALLLVGLGLSLWPLLLTSAREAEHFRGVVWCLLTAVSLLAILGIRYPLKMLPLLFFELVWKVIWVALIGIPHWRAGDMGAQMAETWTATLAGVILVPIVIPWRYVIEQYVRAPGDRWR